MQIDRIFDYLFSKKVKSTIEDIFLLLAVIGFIIHLILIGLYHIDWISIGTSDELLKSPISAIYTPFSFILIYEVYLLIYYLPSSFTVSIGKQYEIVSLILARKIFNDFPTLDLGEAWWSNKYNLYFFIDLAGFIGLFLLIFIYNYLSKNRPKFTPPKDIGKFINFKKAMSLFLVPLLIGLAVYSLGGWIIEAYQAHLGLVESISNVNNIFYDEFFTLLILVDVLILIISLRYTDSYSQLTRNTGFVISTVLIRLSFGAKGPAFITFVFLGVSIGVLILYLYNLNGQVEKKEN